MILYIFLLLLCEYKNVLLIAYSNVRRLHLFADRCIEGYI